MTTLDQLFRETEFPRQCELLLSKLLKDFLKLSDDCVALIDAKKKFDEDEQIVMSAYSVLYQTCQFLKLFANLLDYLFFDSYKFDTVLQ